MTDPVPTDLVVSFVDGQAVESRVPLAGPRLAQWQADQAAAQAAQVQADQDAALIQQELENQIQNALALADLIDANTATPAQQRQALSACLHGIVRLTKAVYRDLATPA